MYLYYVNHGQDHLLKFTLSISMGKTGDLSQCGIVVGARQAGLSISEIYSTSLLGFSHTIFSSEWPEKEKTFSE